MMTISEQLFEQYCNEQEIDCQRIEEGSSKTPDYFVNVDGLDIVIEVKQVDPRKEDNAVLRKFEKDGFIVEDFGIPGSRVRSKIKTAGPQLSRLSKSVNPSILVLYNNLPPQLGDRLTPYEIRVGIYGLETIIFSVPKNYLSPTVIDRKFGGKRRLCLR